MVILTDINGTEIRAMEGCEIDIDVNDTMDFELTCSMSSVKGDEKYGCRVFVPNTEYGGIIGETRVETSSKTITYRGTTWRGFLRNKIIRPPQGQAYKIVSGDLNEILAELFEECGLTLFSANETPCGMSVENYQFPRYINLYDGLCRLYESVGYKMMLSYVQGNGGATGFILVDSTEIVDYSQQIEYSQDGMLDFSLEETKNKCNHLICLGEGELAARQVVDLYIQPDGSITETPYYFGMNDVVDVYDYGNVEGDTSAEKRANLIEGGKQRLLEITNTQEFDLTINSTEFDLDIGDIVGGRDRITGIAISKPITNKVYKEIAGKAEISYSLKGEEQQDDNPIV